MADEQAGGVVRYAVTGVGFGPELVERERQAELLERYTLPSFMAQDEGHGFEWLIACDVTMGDNACELVDHVARRAGARVVWLYSVKDTRWGDIVCDRFMFDEDPPAWVVSVGLPAGGAINTKYLGAVAEYWSGDDCKSYGALSFVGGVVIDSRNRAAYTKNRQNLFTSRKERYASGLVIDSCFVENILERSGRPPVFKTSKAAWLVPDLRDVSQADEIDLVGFGV